MKLGRQYKIIIRTETDEYIQIEPPLTIHFDINRSTMATVNDMNLQIYNLKESTRNKIFQDKFNPKIYKKIILQAGYEQLSTIFVGNVFYAYSHRQETEIITEINARDCDFDSCNAYSSFTISKKTAQKDILKMLCANFSYVDLGEIGDFNNVQQRGAALNGNTFELIRRYSNDKAFFDLETIHILNDNEVLKGEVLKIDSSTGLLGTPLREDATLTANCIFEPRIKVAQVIEVDSDIQKQFNGQYKVIGIKHSATISEAICGDATTVINLLRPVAVNNQFNQVHNGVITPLKGDNVNEIQKVYNYLLKYSTPPNWKITSQIKWSDMLSNYSLQGEVPTLTILSNLEDTAKTLQKIVDTYFSGSTIYILSGWRSSSHNSAIGGKVGSYHIKGMAVDFMLSGISNTTIQNTLNSIYQGGLELGTKDHTHIDIRGYKSRFNGH
jgi:hypothetical protein